MGTEIDRSKALTPNFGGIPPELQHLHRWLCWRFSPDIQNGKRGKIPHNVLGRRANYTDPGEWLAYLAALRQYEIGAYDGIGLVLGGGLCGLDEDHCLTGGELDDTAGQHVAHLNSYTEISVSGDGLHTLALGTLPAGGRKKDRHELYSEV